MTSTENNKENMEYDDLSQEQKENLQEETGDDFDLTQESIENEIKTLKEKEIDVIEVYKLIVEIRKFEIDNFWKRTLFFWGALAIIIAGYFSAKVNLEYLIFASITGFFYSMIFSLGLRGSKYWQEHWERTASTYEKGIGLKLFRWDLGKEIREENEDVFFLLRPYKHSVSKLTMILGDLSCIFWLLLALKDYQELGKKVHLHFTFTNIDAFSTTVNFYIASGVIYLFIFLFWKKLYWKCSKWKDQIRSKINAKKNNKNENQF